MAANKIMAGRLVGLSVLVLALCTTSASAANVLVSPWKLNQTYPPVSLSVGDTITFQWPMGPHGLFSVFDTSCNPAEFLDTNRLIQTPIPTGDVTLTATQEGTFFIACPVGMGLHCSKGMLQTIWVGNKGASYGNAWGSGSGSGLGSASASAQASAQATG